MTFFYACARLVACIMRARSVGSLQSIWSLHARRAKAECREDNLRDATRYSNAKQIMTNAGILRGCRPMKLPTTLRILCEAAWKLSPRFGMGCCDRF